MQNLLGALYASLLPRAGACHQHRLQELDGYQIVDAKCSANVLVVVGARGGTYDKFIFRFDDEFQDYDVRSVTDIPFAGINFVVLDNGLCLHLNERDELEIFSRRHGAAELKVIADPALTSDCKLSHDGAQALFFKDNKLFKISMRRP